MPFVEQLRDGDDLVMGNRFRGGIAPGAMPSLHRYLGNPVLIGHRPAVLPQRRSATSTAACAASTATPSARWTCGPPGMEFASEMVVKATLHGLRDRRGADHAVARRPQPRRRTCAPGATAGGTCASCCSTARAGCSSTPGLALMVLGAAGRLWLLPGPRATSAASRSTCTPCSTPRG